MSEARALTNLIGNELGITVVASQVGELDQQQLKSQLDAEWAFASKF